jgi:hypothetical protein
VSADLIDPDNIPQYTGDLEQLSANALGLMAEAVAFRASGAEVHRKFQGLSSCYSAPEADQLFATTVPVAAKADTFADDLEKVGKALTAYETEIQPLVARLKSLKERAETFRANIAGDEHWRKDNDNVQLNNDLVYDVNATQEAFERAEITCHNAITALVGGSTLVIQDGTRKQGPNTYGYTADLLDQAEDLPWGKTVEKERHGLDWLQHQVTEFGKGVFVDGVWGTVRGLYTLAGGDGVDAMGKAWDGLAKLGTGLSITISPLAGAYWLAPEDKLPAYLRESRRTMVAAGKGLVAYDEWGKNPARAGGAASFNVLTAIFTEGAGAAAKGGSVARTVGVLGKASRVVDPLTVAGKAARFGTVKVADLFSRLKSVHTGAYDDVLSGAAKVDADGKVVRVTSDIPIVRGNIVEWPDGTRLNLDDSTVTRPDGTLAPAKVELSAADREMLRQSLPHEDGALVGAGDRATAHAGGGSATHVGASPAAHAGEHTGSRSTDTLPARDTGGHTAAGDHAAEPGSDGHVPAQHSGSGGGHDGGGGHDRPGSGGRSPLEHEREIMRKQVERANNDPEWFKRYYRSNGYRRSAKALSEYGRPVPQIVRDPFHPGKWIAKSDMPPAIKEHYVHDDPVLGKRSDVRSDVLRRLDEQAATRDEAIKADKAAEAKLKAAEEAYAANPTQELADAMDKADATHSPLHGDANRQSELFGEDVAEHHAIPEHYPDAVRVDDGAFGNNRFDQVYKTSDGRYVVVEAKGSEKANLGVRKGHSGRLVTQGTREYFETVIKEMEKRAARTGNRAEGKLAEQLDAALKDGQVDYVLVKAKSDGIHYAGYEMKQFKISDGMP